MADDPDSKKEPQKVADPSDKDLPPPWAEAMAHQILEVVEKAGQTQTRVSKGSSPGTLGESHSCTHTIAGRSRWAGRSGIYKLSSADKRYIIICTIATGCLSSSIKAVITGKAE